MENNLKKNKKKKKNNISNKIIRNIKKKNILC